MDFLLYSYYLLFSIILLTPFLLFHFKFQENRSTFGSDSNESLMPLKQKKSNTLDSLKDLRSDFHSGKISEEEFQSISIPYLNELDSIEAQLTVLKTRAIPQTLEPVKISGDWKCSNCGSLIQVPKAKFCPECGSSRMA
ncbi:zinc ribbon domain-containing protein [Leptospira ognonensis]|uniref:Zinc ribbon domain-containing protein n=1 Tax=Leptospira ognonensis TaxID=2484945 RepID=A0A4R9JY43_9LEPT|nr:zinc ribbon domain-containing protein [Leptospira ognonensis]TGL57081.1 zinc ribbon domain-containing protein [Leptospira ognonensis]